MALFAQRVVPQVDRLTRAWEAKFAALAHEQFERDRKALMATLRSPPRLGEVEAKAGTIDWQEIGREWEEYLQEAGDDWRAAFLPGMYGVAVDSGEAWSIALGAQFDVRQLYSEAWLVDYSMPFTRDVTRVTGDALNTLLRQALEEGWSIPQMRRHLGLVFQQWMDGDLTPDEFSWFQARMPNWRTEMIARTETIRASTAGDLEVFDAYGAEGKQWWTAPGACVFCAAEHGKVIGVRETFYRQGDRVNVQDGDATQTMALEYEDVQGPPLHPNCRCCLLPWRQEWMEPVELIV
jgi:hypothetical protein